jgi:peptidoglycan/LPS O-acetylase OafA/YrhL
MDRRQDLDGLRGIAILLTVLLHYGSRSGYFPYFGPGPVHSLLDSLWSGVDLFFVLSGFLIGGIVLDSGRTPNFYGVFYARRALRILPVALLTIGVAYLLMPLANPLLAGRGNVPAYAYLLFVNNLWTSHGAVDYPPLGPMWSLAIEQQFYLTAPAILLYAGARARLIGLIAIVVVSPLIRSFDLTYSIWDFTFYRLDGLSAGVLAAALVRDEKFRNFVVRRGREPGLVVVGVIAIALVFAAYPPKSAHLKLAWGVWLNSLAAASAILYLHFRRSSIASRVLSIRPLVLAGRFSYFIYLMHIPALILLISLQGGRHGLPQLLLAFGVTLLAASISWRLLESPLIAIGKRVAYGTNSPTCQPLPAATPSSKLPQSSA